MFIGIDIGGTHTRVAHGKEGKFSDKFDFPTTTLEETLGKIKEVIDSYKGKEFKAVGVSIAGPFNYKEQIFKKPPNLHESWDNQKLSEIFSKETNIPTFVAHDASVAALGEAIHGSGKGKNPVLYYTVSTGIGSGLINNGNIFHGIYNPEAGHQVFSKDGDLCDCGQVGDLESKSSGKALKERTGKEPRDIEGTDLWEEAMEWIALGIANSIIHFSPEVVVIGGGMTKHGNIFFEPVKKSVSKYLKVVPNVPIVPSGLGQDNGIIGALEFARISSENG